MKYIIISVLLSFVCSSSLVCQLTVIQNISVLSMTDDQVVPGQDIWIVNGTIVDIGKTGLVPLSKDVVVINGKGLYAMPGLSEMHAHIPIAEEGDDSRVREVMLLYLSKGVTVIRGMLGNPYHLTFRKQVQNGKILSPRVYTSSPSMNGNSVPTVEAARAAVIQAKKDGYDFLKIHPGIKLDVMEALVKTANEAGIKYSGHVPIDVGIERALQFGYSSVDHADGYIEALVADDDTIDRTQGGFFGSNFASHLDWSKMDSLAQLTLDNNVWIVPTQSLFTRWFSPTSADKFMKAKEMSYMPSATRFAWRNNKSRMLSDPDYSVENYRVFMDARKRILRSLHAKGVRFLLGSDSPQVMNVPGFSIHHEIESLLEAGLPIFDILQSGTANVAEFFGEKGKYGTLVEGAAAELIVLEKNPFLHPESIANPAGVMIRGQWLTSAFLKGELKKIAERNLE